MCKGAVCWWRLCRVGVSNEACLLECAGVGWCREKEGS